MSFSHAERHTIDRFAGQLGLSVRLAGDGTCSFVFETMGTLTLTPSHDGRRIIVSLARRLGWVDAVVLSKALARAGYDVAHGRALHAGLTADDHVLFMTSLDEGEMSLPVLEDCLQQLRTAHESLH